MRRLVIIAALLGVFFARSEGYKAPALYGLKGDVKSVKMKSEFPIADRAVSFTDEGLQDKSSFAYDKEGYPIGFGTYIGNELILLSVSYDDSHKPTALKYRASTKDKNTEFTCTMTYDGERVAETEIAFPNRTVVMTYSDEELDPQGNWISRTVKETVVPADDSVPGSDKVYQETREIKYYK